MQLEIMSKFRRDNPNKTKFLNKNRIQWALLQKKNLLKMVLK
jgi:hypothetical protein